MPSNFRNGSFLLVIILVTIFSQSLSANEDGAALYAQYCSACHGKEGNGGVGVPLALPDFQYAVSDRFLSRTIRHGRPGRIMPAFKLFSDEQIKAIVNHLRTWAPGKRISFPTIKVTGNPDKGKKLYQQNCAVCHGANGEGGHGTGVTFSRPRDLPIIAPALNNSGFLAAASDQMIKATLMNGREGTPMVSFLKHGLSEKDINDVVSFVRSFEAPTDVAELVDHADHPAAKDSELTTVVESAYSLEETITAIKQAVTGKNFRIIRIQNMDNGLVEVAKEDTKKVVIYFCNFDMVNKALLVDPRVGLFLPCRVTVVERQGKVYVYAINPKRLSKLFNNAELNKLCEMMSELYSSIVEEGTF